MKFKKGFIIIFLGIALALGLWFFSNTPKNLNPEHGELLPVTSQASISALPPELPDPHDVESFAEPSSSATPAPSDDESRAALQHDYSLKELGLLAMLERRGIDPHYGAKTLQVLREGKRDQDLIEWIQREIPDEKLVNMRITSWCVENGYIASSPSPARKSPRNKNPMGKIQRREK